MPIDPFAQNYAVGARGRAAGQLYDKLRQKTLQGLADNSTKEQVSNDALVGRVLGATGALRDSYGSNGAAAVMGNFDPRFAPAEQEAGVPDSYANVRDQVALQGLKAGALSKTTQGMAAGAKAGFFVNPVTGETQPYQTPGERIADANNQTREDMAQTKADTKANTPPKPFVPKLDIRQDDGTIIKGVPVNTPEGARYLKSKGQSYDNDAQVIVNGGANASSGITDPNVPDVQKNQLAFQGADAYQKGYKANGDPVQNEDGSITQEYVNEKNLNKRTIIVHPNGTPERVN